MIRFTQGNLLDAPVEVLVNTVNTVGVMGKGIALMFKERFPANMKAYSAACKAGAVQTGKMFVTDTGELMGPRWIINFPTKQHWRSPSKLEWIVEGLRDLRLFIMQNEIASIAIPPLGAGHGGLDWAAVRDVILQELSDLSQVDIIIYEPIEKYQNVTKSVGVEKLTPARALVAELVRRYWVLGMECSLLEIQKLAWFLERVIIAQQVENPLNLQFKAQNYGPYADRLRHLLNGLDGSYLRCEKRLGDAKPLDIIWFNDAKRDVVLAYLKSEAKTWLPALQKTTELIDGFESPYGLELLSTIDWLVCQEHVSADEESLAEGIRHWPAGEHWAQRKAGLFDKTAINMALTRLQTLYPPLI
jgi:O-acetyl-ADP-ribose deacetylase (regulator of RNase III)